MARKRVKRTQDPRLPEHPKEEHLRRLSRARKIMAEEGFDAWIFARNVSVFYMTGSRFVFVGMDAPVALSPQTTAIVTKDADVYCQRFGPFDRDEVGLDTTWSDSQEHYDSELELPAILADYGLGHGSRIAIEWGAGLCTGINPLRFQKLERGLRDSFSAEIVDSSAAVARLMAVKSQLEIDRMSAAVGAAARALDRVRKELAVGMQAREVSRTIFRYMMDEGADALSHAQVVSEGSGEIRLASCDPTDQEIQPGWVHFDVGCKVRRYTSDIARGVFLGRKPTQDEQDLYACRRGVNDLLDQLIRPGVTIDSVVADAGRYVKEKGFVLGVPHGYPFVGHSLGLEFYVGPNLVPTEGQPKLGAPGTKQVKFEEGMVFALESGIQFPDGRPSPFINVEDNAVVTDTGLRSLSFEISRDLMCL